MDDQALKKLQETEFDILCMIDDYCKKYNIKYSLYAGTALGAVRHGGFIPWDDDIDLAMTRLEFDKLCKTWMVHPVQGYHLESILTDEHCGTCHAKIRKNGTILLSHGEIEEEGHHGIWIDIFPLDKVATDHRIQKRKYSLGRELVLLTRANVNSTIDNIEKKITRHIIRVIPQRLRNKRIKAIHAWFVEHMEDGVEAGYEWKSLSTMKSISQVSFQPDLCSEYTELQFNGRLFPAFKQYTGMLEEEFGDFMQLPPVAEQKCTHNPVKLKF